MTIQVSYKGNVISLHRPEPRIGVCNLCRAVYGEIDAQRHAIYQRRFSLHHEQYDDNDPLAYTMEVCPACHRKLDNIKRTCWKITLGLVKGTP
jgi:hypothetical protein